MASGNQIVHGASTCGCREHLPWDTVGCGPKEWNLMEPECLSLIPAPPASPGSQESVLGKCYIYDVLWSFLWRSEIINTFVLNVLQAIPGMMIPVTSLLASLNHTEQAGQESEFSMKHAGSAQAHTPRGHLRHRHRGGHSASSQ